MVRSHIQQSPYSLEAIAIFGGLKPAVVERIQRGCSWRRYEPGEIIVDYLDASNDVFFLTAGEARVTIYSYVGKVVSFGELGAGEVAVLEQLVKRTRAVTNRVYEFSTMHVSSRVQAEILRLARLAPREGKGARITPPPSHVEIASRVSTHREAVTRELTHLCRIGIIERRDDALVVKDIDRLAGMVHEATGE
jgi:CRP/FNR family cyclic AMP-dependent transcriptional regulator